MSINNSLLTSRYPESFTLLDAINDPVIYKNLEKFYVPEVEIKDSIFIKKDASIAITDDGPKRIKFIYLSADGKNITNPDSSYIQIPLNCKGFLARLSISRNQYTAENLEMDYLVDISKINSSSALLFNFFTIHKPSFSFSNFNFNNIANFCI